jgi:hypothetical protein
MRTVWQQLLDRLAAGAVTICADEVARWDKNQWREVLGLGLLRETELAAAVVCDQCGEAHWADVYWVTPGVKACFGCDAEGVIDIELDRLRQWRVDADRVAGLVAGSLDLSSPIEVLLRERLWRIGRRRLGGRYRDIFFGVGAGAPVAEMSAAIRSSIGPGSALLLTVGADGNPEGIPAGQHRLDLASVSRVEGGRVVIDLDYVEERLAGEAPSTRKSSPGIPVPAGAAWRDVSIIVFDGLLRVTVCGKVYEKEFGEIGVDAQSQPVQLLKLFAAARGTLSSERISEAPKGDTPPKTRVRRLRALLQSLIEIDGDPVPNQKKADTYTCAFEIRLADDDGYPTPAGTTWIDFSFHERADGRLLVSTGEKQRRRGLAIDRDDTVRAEVAETTREAVRTYLIDDIVPRPSSGKMPAGGSALLDLLRSGGRIRRAGDDIAILILAQRLREWTGLGQDPLSFSDSTGTWLASFSCSSALSPAK